ncbi:hypothetical protein QWA68_016251 [Fusarium oxysporum]|nr:hypothetical protein QWA68_016251 [Fusarium oxysporum]
MKPIFVSLSSMLLLASATPITSDPASTLPVKRDLTLERRAMLAPDRDMASGNMLEKRASKRMAVPSHTGSAIQNIGVIAVKAIVDASGKLVFEIANNNEIPYLVSLHEVGTFIDAATLDVAGRHTINYDPLGGINPGDIISIHTQSRG